MTAMMTTQDCERFRAGGFVEGYAPGKLSAEEAEAFEAHFLTCDRCQQDLVLAAGIRAALRGHRGVGRRRRWPGWAGGIGLAAAAGLAGILLMTPRRVPAAVARLGAVVQAPVYLGIPVRGGQPATADSLFDAAMTAYTAEHYADAERELAVALAEGVDPLPAQFFLGASALMTGHAPRAVEAYGRVIALGDSPYLAEAHYYRAKALLRLGRSGEALADLSRATRLGGIIGASALALSDSVRGMTPR